MKDFQGYCQKSMDRNVCPGFVRTDKTSRKSKNKTFAHVIEKRSIHELPLNQEIISGGVSESKIQIRSLC